MLVFSCNVCGTSLSADEQQAGQLVRCPTCKSTLRVPQQQMATTAAPAGMFAGPPQQQQQPGPMPGGNPGQFMPQQPGQFGAPRPGAPTGRRYGFNCSYCSSRLEATESMAATEGQCPTCGNAIIIPILDRYGRLIDPITKQIIKPDPHPVHAYAAAGERAPAILRQPDGSQIIRCTKCGRTSPITSNNCRSCGMPFTMEGTTPEAGGAQNGYAVTSLVLGIIGIPFFCVIVPSLLAVIFGLVAYSQLNSRPEGGGRGMAIAGMICGGIGLGIRVIQALS